MQVILTEQEYKELIKAKETDSRDISQIDSSFIKAHLEPTDDQKSFEVKLQFGGVHYTGKYFENIETKVTYKVTVEKIYERVDGKVLVEVEDKK